MSVVESHDVAETSAEEAKAVIEAPAKSLVPNKLSLQQLVRVVSAEIQEHGKYLDKELVKSAMEAYNASAKEWKRFEFWDSDKAYTRNLIATDHETFTLMLLCWNESKSSPVHDHAGSHCFMRSIQNDVEEVRYDMPAPDADPNEPLRLQCTNTLKEGACVYMSDALGLHSVGSYDKPAVTLHLYIPPYNSCKCFYDLTGKSKEGYCTYFSEQGELVKME